MVERLIQLSAAWQPLGNQRQVHEVFKSARPKSDAASGEPVPLGVDNGLLASEPKCFQKPVDQNLILIVSSSSSGILTIIIILF